MASDLLKDKPSASRSAIPRRLGLNESALPASPRSVSFAGDNSVDSTPKKQLRFAMADAGTTGTPKQARFAGQEPSTNEKETSAMLGQGLARSPLGQMSLDQRSVKDRSPTPEK